ncbi:cbb3-type cytochrome c oxidase subunit I [Neobacillus sp. MER 74]|uniref:cbb3-type cytochrome c oxidase subunit I n=1 Tax=Neobacillus sp. MER 74 TaxID=2939566 RepID=UPI00203FB65A|nr:cbb3-type cytochrome c oxidase subunit I [Neobacillus sp. MER 74]MCM3117789.1 cbb3-type cytochrome c oxidase subunit I [Neobacillus sp. MER 74]
MESKARKQIKKGVAFSLMVTSVVLVFMMVFGVMMLLNQGNVVKISPQLFYKVMTIHGTGMIGISALGGSAIMWYYLSKYIHLNSKVFFTNLILSLIGVVMILAAIFVFNFSDGWTFLYPLPSASAKLNGSAGALFFLFGLLLLGIGYLVMYFYLAARLIKEYGGLGKSLGWDYIFRGKKGYGPPAAVVATTMVIIANSTGILAGATAIVESIVNIINPKFTFDPMLAKHLTYAFGHIFANCTIYMAVIAVYEVLSEYTGRPWKSNKAFLIAWNFSTLFTLMIYTHHLLMDFAVPRWMLIIGQIFSYANGLPVMVVTAYGALMIVFRSAVKWDFASSMMFLAMFGWVAGAVPAIIDATIVVNHVMHNTKWVPGHFHTYMGMGVIAMIFGFMYYFTKTEGTQKQKGIDNLAISTYFFFFTGLAGSFLYAGKISTPRRWAEHLPEWTGADQVGALCGVLIIIAVVIFTIRFIIGLRTLGKNSETNSLKSVS